MITRLNGEASARLGFRTIWKLGAKNANDHLTSLPFYEIETLVRAALVWQLEGVEGSLVQANF